jgi:hypothetical protein
MTIPTFTSDLSLKIIQRSFGPDFVTEIESLMTTSSESFWTAMAMPLSPMSYMQIHLGFKATSA